MEIGFPGLPPVTAYRFSFNPAVEACRSGWVAPVETPPPGASLESAGISLKPYALPVSMPVLHELAPVAPTVAGNPRGRTRFRVASGKWPRGLRLDPDTGVISGVPLDAANFVDGFIAMTVDGYSGESQVPYSVHFHPVFLKLYVNSRGGDHLFNRPVGTPLPAGLHYFIDDGAGGHGKLAPSVVATFSAEGHLPAGVTLSPTGALQGTPTTAGSGGFKVHVDIVFQQDFAVRQTLNMSYQIY
ncbi:hypothetical protein FN976_26595 [Caenimonas sedimenti]|uniref:Uncharacterized protein n=1 Tax=Caenimonas sedimenti TaxID=2596921 RepID=A0A562ZFX6_9BURK|nr:putative Ig domain-containing protein [Caenimonas sedimenti]TWO66683.1 hypothetical protein FN976_26595 [Caenimonas sedimenti]